MGKLRHVVLSVPDPWMTAEFYKYAFGFEIVGETDSSISEGVFLSDGVINLALLHFRSDETAQGLGRDFVGIHHLGFWVDDVENTQERIQKVGGKWLMGEHMPGDNTFYEIKYHDPDGVVVDITHNGWCGAQKAPGESGNRVGPPRKLLSQFDERRATAAVAIAKLIDT
jgi:catechol 2,3-dioxygenase-like lactoylglutathione lyase family enzyme